MENQLNTNEGDFDVFPNSYFASNTEENTDNLTETMYPQSLKWKHDDTSNDSDYIDRTLNNPPSDLSKTPNESKPIENIYSDSEFLLNFIGKVTHSNINGETYQIIGDYNGVIQDLQVLPLNFIENDVYDFSPELKSSVGNLIKSLVHLFLSKGLKIQSCNILKTKESISLFNNYTGDKKFILPLIVNLPNDKLTLNILSPSGDPLYDVTLSTGILNILEGWVPYKLTRLNSQELSLYIVGDLIQV